MSEAYKRAGVNLSAGYETIRRIKPLVEGTRRPEVLGGLGGFGGLFELPLSRYRNPVLVSGTDGVGTKLKLAFEWQKHDTVGIDLVAMCANDIVVSGAEPLFFLDYVACGKLDPGQVEEIVKGIAQGCRLAGCALIGGETAEMPDFYPEGEYDLAGFCVGIVEKDELITGQSIGPGDVLIGIPSSGVHSNGFSLVRRILKDKGIDLKSVVPEIDPSRPLGEVLLEPTCIYVPLVLHLTKRFTIKGMAHITGGGLVENVPRMLPENCQAHIDRTAWSPAPLFQWLAEQGQIDREDMYQTFNMGIGFVLAVAKEEVPKILNGLEELGQKGIIIGRIEAGSPRVVWEDGGHDR